MDIMHVDPVQKQFGERLNDGNIMNLRTTSNDMRQMVKKVPPCYITIDIVDDKVLRGVSEHDPNPNHRPKYEWVPYEDFQIKNICDVKLVFKIIPPLNQEDWKNWKDKDIEPYVVPRPGHADLIGTAKYNSSDIRLVLERSSARETAMRCALGAIAAQILESFEINICGYVSGIGKVDYVQEKIIDLQDLQSKVTDSPVSCPDEKAGKDMENEILEARKKKDTLGGSITTIASGVPPTLGSFVHWDRKLDANLARIFMSIQSVKAVEIGNGIEASKNFGTDEIGRAHV